MAQLSEDPRTAQLAANLAEVRARIAGAAREVGRDPGEVALIAVTKTFDADDVRRLAALGIAEFGENRDQEAAPKAAAVPEVRWHFLGRIQRNKIRSIASYADSVDSVDRAALVDPLDRAVSDRAVSDRAESDRVGQLDVLLQVSLDGDPARGGVVRRRPAGPGRPDRGGGPPPAGWADGRCPARRRRRAQLRRSRRPRGADPGGTPAGEGAFGRHERRSRGRRTPRVHPGACRDGVAGRQAARRQVTSPQKIYRSPEEGRPMAGAMRKMGIYLGLVEDDERPSDAADYDDYDEYADESPAVTARRDRTAVRPWSEESPAVTDVGYDDVPLSRITTLHPRTYNEARTIGEHFRDGVPVIINLTEMDDADAKRLVDFAAGLSFGLRGSIERVTNKVFLLSPQNVRVTAEDKARIAEGGFFNQS